MATTAEHQMSLTVAPRGSSSHLNKPARQLVPAFLQKLYEMVNDPADQDLIRWSDTGDSFFVLDQERFASEVLGRWFKHKNFSSFVRQLNMYGFHKIPHLQQGVLRSDSDTEFWNFEHPHFLRGQPDLLCLIQRKKQAAPTSEDSHVVPAASKDAANSAVGTLSPNQLLDINSIVNGIQAIKRHQAAISADLNELKSSNQHLWQEAMAARERHKKHQDTINRILKFLAGVFGHVDNQMGKDDDVTGATHAVIPRKPPQRLLIGNGRSSKKPVETTEVAEDEPRSSMESAKSTDSTSVFDFFEPMDTPSDALSEAFTSPRFASIEPPVSDAPTPTTSDARPAPQERQQIPNPTPSNPSSTALTTTSAPSQTSNDSAVQAALTSVLSSPSQMQKLLAALASQSISPEAFSPVVQPHHHQHLLAPSPYDPSQQYTPMIANAPSPFSFSLLGGPSDADQIVPFEQHDEKLQKSFRTATEINSEVDDLENSIQSLIRSLGADTGTLDAALPPSDGVAAGLVSSGTGAAGDVEMYPSPIGNTVDFDFDSFLMDMPRTNEDDGDFERLAERLESSSVVGKSAEMSSRIGNPSSEQLHTFLDEVASQGGDGSAGGTVGMMPTHGGTQAQLQQPYASQNPSSFPASLGNSGYPTVPAATTTGLRGRKRKSDVSVDVGDTYPLQEQTPTPTTNASSISGNKSKRKR
ncbi:hypothetical protein BU15DRAFT_44428 [Melanogaster broomeanus]|nr:hypothetical protein BU15DRAFT_44428 [Melanogaster broomeanus]